MKRNKKRYLAWFLAVMMLAALTGCAGTGGQDDEVIVDYPVTLYYVNPDYLETGDESVEPLITKEATLSLEEDEAEERYEETLELLADSEDGADTMIRYGMVDEVAVSGGLATVNFDSEEMHGGSMEETYLIEQIVRTLIKSFDDVERVRFTVDEQEVDTLMGHLAANCTYGLITVEEEGADVELVSILDQ